MRLSALYLSALCLPLLWASPIEIGERDSVGVTAAQLGEFVLFSQYAAAAYCYGNIHGNAGASISCSAGGGSCPLVESAHATVLKAFTITADTQTEGYVALDDTNKLIVVAFQGTRTDSNFLDLITDVDVIQRDTTLCGTANTHDGCQVHDGFYRSMQDAATVVTPVVASAVAAHPSYKIVTTGHSLGAAIAALLGVQLRNEGNTVDIYTFGQPHLGNVDISNYVQGQSPSKGSNYRITHTNDVVPQLPPHDWTPEWDHWYPEYWVMTDTVPVPATSIKIVTGSLYETTGNEGATSGDGVLVDIVEGAPAHGKYFGSISSCSSAAPSS